MSEQQTQAADDPSGDGWRDVEPDEILQPGDMFWVVDHWEATHNAGTKSFRYGNGYRRRSKSQPQPEPQPNPDDPGGPGWRDVTTGGVTQDGDMVRAGDDFPLGRWVLAEPGETVTDDDVVRRRIEPQQANLDDPSNESCNQALAAYAGRMISVCGHLSDYGDRIQESQQVNSEPENAELQQLRDQVLALTLERDRYQSWLKDHHKAGQQALAGALQAWLRPVLEVVADHPDDTSILAASVLEFLPQIASRLIEE